MNFTQIKEQIDKNNARIQQLMSPDIFVLNNEIAALLSQNMDLQGMCPHEWDENGKCKWCYADGEYLYHNMDDLIEVCIGHMANETVAAEQVRTYMKTLLPTLNYWKNYENLAGAEKFEEFKAQLIDEINALQIEGMPRVEKLNALVGGYINLEYRLPNGSYVKFLNDNATYLGNQVESIFGGDRCFGIAANMEFILISTYEENGANPELVVYKKR